MDATTNQYWPVVIETPDDSERVCVVAYPRRPTPDLAAGLVRMQLGMPAMLPDAYRFRDDASLHALQAAGYRLVAIG